MVFAGTDVRSPSVAQAMSQGLLNSVEINSNICLACFLIGHLLDLAVRLQTSKRQPVTGDSSFPIGIVAAAALLHGIL